MWALSLLGHVVPSDVVDAADATAVVSGLVDDEDDGRSTLEENATTDKQEQTMQTKTAKNWMLPLVTFMNGKE